MPELGGDVTNVPVDLHDGRKLDRVLFPEIILFVRHPGVADVITSKGVVHHGRSR